MKSLRLVLRYTPAAQHPMHRFMTEHDAIEREWLVAWNLSVEEDITYALFYVIGERDAYEDALASVETNVDYDLTPVHEGAFYAYIQERDTERFRRFHAAFEQPTLMVVPPFSYHPHGVLTFDVVGEPEALEAVLDELPEGITAEVREIGEYNARPGVLAADLTARQREALTTAREVGYYEVPREGECRGRGRCVGLCAEHCLESSPEGRSTADRTRACLNAPGSPAQIALGSPKSCSIENGRRRRVLMV